jgi:hypothetical protein
MSRVEAIISEIQQLSLSERAELAKWLHGWEDDDWDCQMARDAAEGKLDKLCREVDAEIDSTPAAQPRLADMIGRGRGCFVTPEEADQFLRRERDT